MSFKNEQEQEQPAAREAQEAIFQAGVPELPQNATSPIQCVTIIGQIEGHVLLPPHNKTTKYEHILPMLLAIEQSSDIKGFIILLNTVGGDVEAGLAIAEMIASMSKPSVSIVLGGGHSIGVPLAVSATRSFIADTATMTIHPIRMTGMIIGVPQTYEYMNKMQERVVRFVCEHSNITRESYERLTMHMGSLANDIGTVLIGREAVDCGLIGQVGGLDMAISALKELIKEREDVS